ncbi:MAG: SHOCT domain-containing protein [Armatimonadota bacterium]
MWYHHPYWGVAGGLMVLYMLLFWAAILVGVYLIVRAVTQHQHPVSAMGPDNPRAILDRRLAAGEITTDEYDALLRKIAGDTR